jgi:predicted 3-demethylubiquinone-9 3-methyltransferase (glyoxalase superfamily)
MIFFMQKITPFLWYDGKAEEAANFYVSVFKEAKIKETRLWGEAGPGPKGSVLSVTFELFGQEYIAFNGGPQFKFSKAISLFVFCETQAEVDRYWEKLSADGGQTIQCGWLTDRFGMAWQIVPTVLWEYLRDKDGEKSQRVMRAMMQMTKLEIEGLKRAYEGK